MASSEQCNSVHPCSEPQAEADAANSSPALAAEDEAAGCGADCGNCGCERMGEADGGNGGLIAASALVGTRAGIVNFREVAAEAEADALATTSLGIRGDRAFATKVAMLAATGPRYTSYPPATSFASFSSSQVVQHLQALAETAQPVSLYVHIPFCRTLCWYCGCNVIATRDRSKGETYVQDLADEIALVASRLRGCLITEVALGGGSPNFLTEPALAQLMDALRASFTIAPDARMSIELDPRTTTQAFVTAIAAAGFRSASIGVQDFSPAVQQAIGRHQSFEQTRDLVQWIRTAGFDDVNVDLVYGLPNQTEESFAQTLAQVVALAPDRVAVFGYAHLPSRIPAQRLVERNGTLPDTSLRAALSLTAADAFTQAGYVALGIDHFARPDSALARAARNGTMIRTFQGYVAKRSEAVVGIGASAISTTDGAFWQNSPDVEVWRDQLNKGRYPVVRGIVLSQDDRLRRDVIMALMCQGRANLTAIADEYGRDAAVEFADALAALQDDAALAELRRDDKTVVVECTALGRVLTRNVCQLFDRHRPRTANFSSTI